MGLFSRRSKGGAKPSRREANATADALAEWVANRRGVEVYVEPKTAVTENTVLLVAHDGEFTRRRVPSPDVARTFARKHGLPIYDATVVGYPQRMRDYSRRETIQRQRDLRKALDES